MRVYKYIVTCRMTLEELSLRLPDAPARTALCLAAWWCLETRATGIRDPPSGITPPATTWPCNNTHIRGYITSDVQECVLDGIYTRVSYLPRAISLPSINKKSNI